MTGPPGDWWWWPAGTHLDDRPLLFFPPAGAEQGVVRPLLAHCAGLRLGVLRLPGRGARRHEEPPRELAPLAESIARSLTGIRGPAPILVGHSFGGLLAYAVAAEIEARGRRVARLITLASASPAAWSAEVAADRDAHPGADRTDFVTRRTARILANGGVPAGVADHVEYREEARALVAVDIGLAYGGFGTARLTCPVTAIHAADDVLLDPAAVGGWAAATSSGCDAVTVPGDHFFYRRHPRDLVTRLRLEVASVDADMG